MAESSNKRTLYQSIGGEAAVRASVDLFYERALKVGHPSTLSQPFFTPNSGSLTGY